MKSWLVQNNIHCCLKLFFVYLQINFCIVYLGKKILHKKNIIYLLLCQRSVYSNSKPAGNDRKSEWIFCEFSALKRETTKRKLSNGKNVSSQKIKYQFRAIYSKISNFTQIIASLQTLRWLCLSTLFFLPSCTRSLINIPFLDTDSEISIYRCPLYANLYNNANGENDATFWYVLIVRLFNSVHKSRKTNSTRKFHWRSLISKNLTGTFIFILCTLCRYFTIFRNV